MKNQEQRVFDFLKKNKTATGLQLLQNCGVLSYTKRISQLRRTLPAEGYNITSEYIKVRTRYNGVTSVKKYTLVKLPKKKK